MLALLFLFPHAAGKGAKSGLLLWFEDVLPALLPAMILSGLCIRLGIVRYLAAGLAPVGRVLFGLSPYGCYPAFLGFLTGLPAGAAATAELVVRGDIEKAEGEYLITFCNNMSPMFLISYAASDQLGIPGFGLPLCIIVWISSILSARIIRLIRQGTGTHQGTGTGRTPNRTAPDIIAQEISHPSGTLTELADEAIMEAFTVLTKVGGYIVLFSILSAILSDILGSGMLSCLISGILETTTGIQNAASLAESTQILPNAESLQALGKGAQWLSVPSNARLFAVSAVCGFNAFGGLSGLAQTGSVTRKAGLSLKWYAASKLLAGLLASAIGAWYCVQFLSK